MSNENQSPPIAIGHVVLYVSDTVRAAGFYRNLGLRHVFENEEMAILELRGGTHLMLFRTGDAIAGGPISSFDLMVDDMGAFRDLLLKTGISTSEVVTDAPGGHHMFEVTDPDGHVLKVFSSHTEGRPV